MVDLRMNGILCAYDADDAETPSVEARRSATSIASFMMFSGSSRLGSARTTPCRVFDP